VRPCEHLETRKYIYWEYIILAILEMGGEEQFGVPRGPSLPVRAMLAVPKTIGEADILAEGQNCTTVQLRRCARFSPADFFRFRRS
jgi:hypothetical protein